MAYDKHDKPLIIGDFIRIVSGHIYQISNIQDCELFARSITDGWLYNFSCKTAEKVDPKEAMFSILKGNGK